VKIERDDEDCEERSRDISQGRVLFDQVMSVLFASARVAPSACTEVPRSKKRPPLGHYSRPVPRALWWSQGGGGFL
jgi:hypothetical protein